MFNGRFSAPVPPFNIPVSSVQYDSVPSGVAHIEMGSVVGQVKENVILDNGSVISGNLMPPLDRGYSVTGEGTWDATF
jgi:hypothetical protein